MMNARASLWTLDELCARVPLALADDYPGQASGRVRDVPDRRTVRYYTTLGLLDRPRAWRGRTALYGLRHLLQLAAIKRLQTHGLSLVEIQGRLLGMGDAALRRLARLPADFEAGGTVSPETAPEDQGGRGQEAFWAEPPAEVAEGGREVNVPLAPGVRLVVDARREPDDYDVSALAAAAAPLLKLLRTRRLLGPDGRTGSTEEDTP